MGDLFRKEAIQNSESRIDGEVLIAQPPSANIVIAVLVGVLGLSIVFLANGDYARRAQAVGYLRTGTGLESLSATISGRVDELGVREGQRVFPGDVLGSIISEQYGVSGRSSFQTLLGANQKKLALLQEQLDVAVKLHEERQTRTVTALTIEKDKLASLRDEEKVLREQQRLEQEKIDAVGQLVARGAVPASSLKTARQEMLAHTQSLIANNLSIEKQRQQIESQRAALARLPLELEQEKNRLQHLMLELEETNTRLLSRHSQLMITKTGGVVSNLAARLGDRVSVGEPLMQIIPSDSTLHAELLVPGEAAGMVLPGQEVQLRYTAFPHQRFGVVTGKLTEVSRSVSVPSHSHFSGRTGPTYIARAAIPAQSITAYGQIYPLKPGMLLEADIILEKRPLIQWLLDPVFSIRGRLQ
ncbi:HlyD family secretion protein [Biformimicrobium ophioploci]|uniref:HlyD family efflux transporter periplasmic adaptor subunit n=1 Tax=Biformimicrobium ophioploci TaxID=3036711 RepID=A0ABQ6LUC8_9GAMM|nr:HlyD family efflux transporter periplasmic adaptor subunit [Microbulbifer sp. NKW57]GMG85693.1 HlyD family efflux transporter periplasmic adaptor subunit [Microbulbifer sp. NKW57]